MNNKRFVIGVAAMEAKARSKPMRNILQRLLDSPDFDTVIFGDKVILDEGILISISININIIELYSHRELATVRLSYILLLNWFSTAKGH